MSRAVWMNRETRNDTDRSKFCIFVAADMGAISAFSTAAATLKRNHVLLGAAFIVTMFNFGFTAVTALFPPSLAGLISLPLSGLTLLLTPFFIGGLLAVAYEGLDGVSRVETFLDGGKANYLRLLGSMVLFGALFTALTIAVVIGVAVIAVFVVGMNVTGAGGGLAASGGGLAVVAVAGLLGFLILVLPMYFLQFYAPAIVVSDLGVVDSFKRSAGLVRQNLVSTLGYMLITGLIGVVAGVAGVFVTMFGELYGTTPGTESLFPEVGVAVLVPVVIVVVVVTTVLSAFGVAYQVAFYDDRLATLESLA